MIDEMDTREDVVSLGATVTGDVVTCDRCGTGIGLVAERAGQWHASPLGLGRMRSWRDESDALLWLLARHYDCPAKLRPVWSHGRIDG